jgi:hypothetical protein
VKSSFGTVGWKLNATDPPVDVMREDFVTHPFVVAALHGSAELTLASGKPPVYRARSWVQQSPQDSVALKVNPLNSVRIGLHIGFPLGEHGSPVVVEFQPSTIAFSEKFAGLVDAAGATLADTLWRLRFPSTMPVTRSRTSRREVRKTIAEFLLLR